MLCELNIYYVYKLEYVTVCTHLKIWPAFKKKKTYDKVISDSDR